MNSLASQATFPRRGSVRFSGQQRLAALCNQPPSYSKELRPKSQVPVCTPLIMILRCVCVSTKVQQVPTYLLLAAFPDGPGHLIVTLGVPPPTWKGVLV